MEKIRSARGEESAWIDCVECPEGPSSLTFPYLCRSWNTGRIFHPSQKKTRGINMDTIIEEAMDTIIEEAAAPGTTSSVSTPGRLLGIVVSAFPPIYQSFLFILWVWYPAFLSLLSTVRGQRTGSKWLLYWVLFGVISHSEEPAKTACEALLKKAASLPGIGVLFGSSYTHTAATLSMHTFHFLLMTFLVRGGTEALLERFVSPFMCQFAIRLAKVLRPARHHLRTASRHIASLPFITWVDAAIARVWTKPQRRMQRPYGAMDSDVYQRTQSGKGTKDMRASTAASQKGSSHSGSDSSMEKPATNVDEERELKDISLPPTKSGKTRWVTGIFSRRARKAAKAAEAAKREAEATDRGDGSDGDGSSSTIEAQTPSKKDVLWSFAVPA